MILIKEKISKDSENEGVNSAFLPVTESSDSVFLPETEGEEEIDFHNPDSCAELSLIINNVTWENPVSDVLFMGKYLVFLLDNLVTCQKPIGEYFKSTFVICAAKLKKLSKQENNATFCDTSFSPFGNPLLVQFEKLICPSPARKQKASILQQLNLMYHMYPLSVQTGTKLLFMCSKFENHYKLPFISICHGNAKGSLVLHGSGGRNNAFRLKLSNQGKVSSLKNLSSIEDLKASHLVGVPPSLTSKNSIETSICAIYEFLGVKSDDKSNLVPVKGAQLKVQCTWSAAQALLEPLPIDCVCFAKLKNTTGDEESGAFLRYKEIKLLKALQYNLRNDIMTSISTEQQCINEVENGMTWISSNSLDLVLQEINECVDEERKRFYSQDYPKLSEKEDCLENIIATERAFLSLPDKLWIILKNCSSFEDLLEAIRHIYKVFSKLNIYPLVHEKGLSTLSKDIISMFEKKIYCTELNQKRAAELVLEIGVEKMRRDYHEYFIGHGFITQDLFNCFTQPELLSPEAVTSLEKLHSVLELAIVCMQQLKLPRSILNEFVRNALKLNLTVSELDLQHVFSFHVPTCDIRPILNMMRPVVWDLSLKSKDKHFLKQSCHHFVTTATHDHIYAPQNHNPKLMLKGASYVYSSGILIGENVLP